MISMSFHFSFHIIGRSLLSSVLSSAIVIEGCACRDLINIIGHLSMIHAGNCSRLPLYKYFHFEFLAMPRHISGRLFARCRINYVSRSCGLADY